MNFILKYKKKIIYLYILYILKKKIKYIIDRLYFFYFLYIFLLFKLCNKYYFQILYLVSIILKVFFQLKIFKTKLIKENLNFINQEKKQRGKKI